MVQAQLENEIIEVGLENSSTTVPSGEVWKVQIQNFTDNSNRDGVRINGFQVSSVYDNTQKIPMYGVFRTVVTGGDTISSPTSGHHAHISGYRVDSSGNNISNVPVSVQLSNSSVNVPSGEKWNVNLQCSTSQTDRDYVELNGTRIQGLYDNNTGIPQQSNFDFVLTSGDTLTCPGSIDGHVGGFKI